MALNVIEPGWLYVIANPAMPRVCKVGFTTREPEERAAELHDTGSPQPYHVVAKWHVPTCGRQSAAHMRCLHVSARMQGASGLPCLLTALCGRLTACTDRQPARLLRADCGASCAASSKASVG